MSKPRSSNLLILTYGLGLAGAAFFIQWLEYQYAIELFSTELYIVIVAIVFTVMGLWVGVKINTPAKQDGFTQNARAIESLNLTAREVEVLEQLAAGKSNQEIADQLFVSISTIKTHLVHLYQKLEVLRRTQAVQKAQALSIIP